MKRHVALYQFKLSCSSLQESPNIVSWQQLQQDPGSSGANIVSPEDSPPAGCQEVAGNGWAGEGSKSCGSNGNGPYATMSNRV